MKAAERQKPAPGELNLDHVAHFVPDLDAAGRLLAELGFTVTPVSHHEVGGKPAGTANRCVMFERGYIEILAPTLATPNAERVRAHMARYAGVHLVCFGTPAAEAEQARLAAHGFAPDPAVHLERADAEGRRIGFRVVYVPPGRMPEGRVQYCEHLTPQFVWDERYVAHANGALGLSCAYVVADDPAESAGRWARFSGLLPARDGEFVRLDSARGGIVLGRRDAMAKLFGAAPPAPSVAGFSIAFRDPGALESRCTRLGIATRKSGRGISIALPPALGGAWLAEASR